MCTILEFGLTCILWDHDIKSYMTKTFIMPIYPGVIGNSFHCSCLSKTLDRCISMSDRSLVFLKTKGFNMADVFREGVPSLSEQDQSSNKVSEFMSGTRPAE
ncbi:hypothetical protein DHEL01_v201123 [Diaporthe helianthi]|uniref:Uncharacterized protein n=1 Tax=Diaporthe helianthi TaxID=158607 RepID=A0A2P5IDC5_DIAHE|nr:hypothetical protein DHEL01_v201123 [Diaporthe helianthi]